MFEATVSEQWTLISEAMPTDTQIPASEEVAAMPGPAQRGLRRNAWRIAGDLPASFRYAAQGLGYAFLSQRNFRIHVITAAVVFALGHGCNWTSPNGGAGADGCRRPCSRASQHRHGSGGRSCHWASFPPCPNRQGLCRGSVLVAAISSLLIALFLLLPPLLLRLGL